MSLASRTINRDIELHSSKSPYVELYTSKSPYVVLHSSKSLYVVLHSSKSPYVVLHSSKSPYVVLHSSKSPYVELHSIKSPNAVLYARTWILAMFCCMLRHNVICFHAIDICSVAYSLKPHAARTNAVFW